MQPFTVYNTVKTSIFWH